MTAKSPSLAHPELINQPSATQLVQDVSFLKMLLLISCGDIEVNPGPTSFNDETPNRKGRPSKKGFRGTPKRLKFSGITNTDDARNSTNLNEQPSAMQSTNNPPVGLTNVANDCCK